MRPTLDNLPCITTKALFPSDSPSHRPLTLVTSESAWHFTVTGSSITALERRHVKSAAKHRPQRINVIWKLCGAFGAPRPLMTCPTCKRHCRHLYLRYLTFVCRRCTGTIYRCQTHGTVVQLGFMVERLQQQLAPDPHARDRYSLRDIPPRPKGMHSRTYQRLVNRLSDYQQRQDEAFLATLRR